MEVEDKELQILHKRTARRGRVFKAFPGRAVFHLTRHCSMHQRVVIGRPAPRPGSRARALRDPTKSAALETLDRVQSMAFRWFVSAAPRLTWLRVPVSEEVICRMESKREKATAERGERND